MLFSGQTDSANLYRVNTRFVAVKTDFESLFTEVETDSPNLG